MPIRINPTNAPPELPGEVIELAKPVSPLMGPVRRMSRESLIWLLATVLLFLTGLFKGINLLVLLAYLLGGIWLRNRFTLRSDMRRLRGKRSSNGTIFAGEPIDCTVELACSGKRSIRGIVVTDCSDGHRRKWLVLSLKPNTPLRIRHRETFHNRGRHRVDVLRAFSGFPFGLTSNEAELSPSEEWIVLPRLGHVHIDQMRQWLARVQRGDGRMRRRHLLPAPQEADVHGLRDFRLGDSPRWIHWRSSARRNQLLVREFEDSSQPIMVLVVEPWLPANASADDRERLEALISLAGTIVRDWCREPSSRMSLVVTGPNPIVWENGAGCEFAKHLLETLAIEPGHSDSGSVGWLQDAKRVMRSAPFLVLSSRTDSKLDVAISAELGRAVARLDVRELPSWYCRPVPVDPTAQNV